MNYEKEITDIAVKLIKEANRSDDVNKVSIREFKILLINPEQIVNEMVKNPRSKWSISIFSKNKLHPKNNRNELTSLFENVMKSCSAIQSNKNKDCIYYKYSSDNQKFYWMHSSAFEDKIVVSFNIINLNDETKKSYFGEINLYDGYLKLL